MADTFVLFGSGTVNERTFVPVKAVDNGDGTFALDVDASGGVVVTPQTVTFHAEDLAATESQIIPAGAKGYGIWILTGTATVGGKTAVAGMFIGDSNTLAASLTVTMAASSTGFVTWNT